MVVAHLGTQFIGKNIGVTGWEIQDFQHNLW
jgi:hypothetical protein